jgi:hypothetical protein
MFRLHAVVERSIWTHHHGSQYRGHCSFFGNNSWSQKDQQVTYMYDVGLTVISLMLSILFSIRKSLPTPMKPLAMLVTRRSDGAVLSSTFIRAQTGKA